MKSHEAINANDEADLEKEIPESQWSDLAGVEFVGDKHKYGAEDVKTWMTEATSAALGLVEPKSEENFVSVDGFIDQQPKNRQAEMKRDFVNLELLRLGMKNADQDNSSETRKEYMAKKFDIINKHLGEPDCVEYLMEVTGEPIEVTVAGMFIANSRRALGHFEHISEMLEDGFGDEAEQAAYNMFQHTAIFMDMAGWGGNDASMVLRPDDYVELFGLAGERGLEIDDYLPFGYLRTVAAAGSKEDREKLFDNLGFLNDYGATLEIVVGEFCRDGEFMALLEYGDRFDQFNLDVKKSVDDFVQNSIKTPKDVAINVLKNPKAYQEYGIDVKRVLENNLPRAWEVLVVNGIHKWADKLEEVGIDLAQIENDHGSLLSEIETGFQEEFREKYISQNNLPPEVRVEWQRSADMVVEREDPEQTRTILQEFTSNRWDHKDREEQEQAIREYAAVLAENYNLSQPYEIRLVPDKELNATDNDGTGNSTWGLHKVEYTLARDPSMQEYAEKMHQAGIETTWLYRSIVSINENCLENGIRIADTVAHELRHAFQREQEFLWRMGYYNQEDPQGNFDYLPQLAQYFAANFQSGNYYEAEDSYTDYREQLLEADAFMLGEHYVSRVEAEEASQLAPVHQSARQFVGQKLKNWWQNRKGGKDGTN